MARIKGIQEFVETTATLSITPPLPDHVAGDLLLVFAVGDNVISSFSAAGWTIGGQQQSSGTTTAACRAAWIYKLAASSNESITIASSSTTWTVTALALDGVNQSTPIDVSNGNGILISANPGTGTSFEAASITTTTSNALVLYTMFNSLSTPSPFPGVRTVSSHDSGLTGVGIGAYVQSSAGVAGTWEFYTENHTSTDQNSVSFTLAIRDLATSATYIPAYLDKSHAAMVTPLRGATPSIRGETWNTSATSLYTNIPQVGRRLNKKVVQFDNSASTFTDITTAANNSTTGDFNLLAGTPDTNDYVAFCADQPFASLSGVHTTLGAGGTSTWEVLNGSTWTAITVTFGYWSTVNWTTFTWPAAPVSEKYSMVISPADLRRISAIWKPSTLNGTTGYWMRNIYSSAPSTNPTCTYIVPSEGPTFYDAISAAVDTGGNAFHNSAASTPSQYSPTIPGLSGTYISLGTGIAPYNPSNKLLIGTWTFGTPRDYVDAGARSELAGVALSVFDASWNDRTYYIGGYQTNDTDQNGRNTFVLQWNAGTGTYNNLGTSLSEISAVGVFSRQMRGAGIQNFNQLVAYGIPKVSGGTTTNPIQLTEFLNTFSIDYYYPIPLIKDNISIIPIQFGGADSVKINLDSFALRFAKLTTEPAAFSDSFCALHVDTDYLGLIFDGRSGDVIKLTNAIISAPDSWRFEFLNTASNLCTWDFANTTVVNATVTLKNVTTFDSMTFRNCTSINITGCTVNNSVIQSCATVEVNGASLSGTTFNASTGTNALTVDSTAEMDNLDNLYFVNNSRAIKITAAGTYNLDAITFSNNTYDIENASTGAVTIRLLNGANATSVINSGVGATTSIVTPFNFEISNIISGTEVRILKQSDLSELAGAEVVSGTPSGVSNAVIASDPDNVGRYTFTYFYDYTTDIPVFVVIYNTVYKALRISYILKSADSVLQSAQQIDRQYLNPV